MEYITPMISIEPHPANKNFDIIIISGEYWADHPHCGVGVIARVLSTEGYSVGIIEKPDWTNINDFIKLGMPNLFWGITSGAVDSMLQNYTPLKNSRKEDNHNPFDSKVPDRAIIVYSQMIRQAQNKYLKNQRTNKKKNIKKDSSILKKKPIVIGGVEASLRRFTHYDYWDNSLRRPIILDSRADILVYGPGELQIKEIAFRLKNNIDLINIKGTCIATSYLPQEISKPSNFEYLPSHEEVETDKTKFCAMQLKISNTKNLIQKADNRYIIQFKQSAYSTKDIDELYKLSFTYDIPEKHTELKMAQFSIITHRGCIGNCNFCAIALHQGKKIISRSKSSILKEIKKMSKHPDFKGHIGDIGGPSANMYGMDCEKSSKCDKECINCQNLDKTHKNLTDLLQSIDKLPEVKKAFVRSGIRYDIAMEADEEYWVQLINNHISGYLKIAPEHFSLDVLSLMNKNNERFDEFLEKFKKLNHEEKWILKYYFITAHPGSTMSEAKYLGQRLKNLGEKKTNKIQIFTPTPMSISTCMYYTGLDPFTMKKIYIPYSYNEKKKQKRILFQK